VPWTELKLELPARSRILAGLTVITDDTPAKPTGLGSQKISGRELFPRGVG